MALADLLDPEVLDAVPKAHQALPIAHVSCDSRDCQANTLFAAWHGERSDGHAFVPDAVARGACFVLCQKPLPEPIPHLVCADPRQAAARAAQRLWAGEFASLRLVGITGTNGKTTCAHLVASVLAAAGGQAAAIGTLGASRFADGVWQGCAPLAGGLTTPEGPALCAQLAQWGRRNAYGVAIEASSIALAQGRLGGLAFDVCAMTNLSHDHLDVHGTMEAYGAAKALLFSRHQKAGAARVLNADDAFQKSLRGLAGPSLWTSSRGPRGRTGQAADVFARQVTHTPQGMHIDAEVAGQRIGLRSALIGPFNVDNVLLAAAVGHALGLPLPVIAEGIARLSGVPGRLQRVRGPDGAKVPLVLVDYAHTPDALARALAAVRALLPRGRLFCVFGCGGDRDAKKRAPMGAVAAAAADWIVVTNDNPRREAASAIAGAIEDGLREGGARPGHAPPRRREADEPAQYVVELDRHSAIALALASASPHDAILIAGKGHETYQEVGEVRSCFDDAAVAAQWLGAGEPR